MSCTPFDILPVGSKPLGAGRWGHRDLAGSVSEWTLDSFGSYGTVAVVDFAYIDVGEEHVSRGGSFMHENRHLRSSARFGGLRGERYAYDGFRCARDP